jgi:hypothetical protein
VNDPRHRLYRPVLGESFHKLSEAADKAFAWDRPRCERTVEFAEHREPRDFSTRQTRQIRTPGHYAPKLIRLVRHPYALSAARWEKRSGGDRARPEVRERLSFTEATAKVAHERPHLPKPTDVHPRLERRDRPSADAFLASGGKR